MRSFFFPALILGLLAACGGGNDEKPKVDLSLTCQLSKCICAGPDLVFLERKEPEPVRWKANGDAYCPEGMELRLADD